MNWKHKCSLDWLKARQGHLTASDVKSLLPVTKTGRPRKVTDEDRLKIYANKLIELTEEDCVSTGAMARGHLLEPYAVAELNIVLHKYNAKFQMYHWDDELVCANGRSLAFSPDAMDVLQGSNPFKATHIAEVKCYSPQAHLQSMRTVKEQLDERWQIATAMAVSPAIEDAYLVFFNPRMFDCKLLITHYSRKDLADEIDQVLKVEGEWDAFLSTLDFKASARYHSCNADERVIVSELERMQALNP